MSQKLLNPHRPDIFFDQILGQSGSWGWLKTKNDIINVKHSGEPNTLQMITGKQQAN